MAPLDCFFLFLPSFAADSFLAAFPQTFCTVYRESRWKTVSGPAAEYGVIGQGRTGAAGGEDEKTRWRTRRAAATGRSMGSLLRSMVRQGFNGPMLTNKTGRMGRTNLTGAPTFP